MPCKYFAWKQVPMEMELPVDEHETRSEATCTVKPSRPNQCFSEAELCKQASENGPCWWWAKHHKGEFDPAFPKR